MNDRFLKIMSGEGYVRSREIKIIKKIITESIEPNSPCMLVLLLDDSECWVEIPDEFQGLDDKFIIQMMNENAKIIPAEPGWSIAIIEDALPGADLKEYLDYDIIDMFVTTFPVIGWEIGKNVICLTTNGPVWRVFGKSEIILLPPDRSLHPNSPFAIDGGLRVETYRTREAFAEAVRTRIRLLRYTKARQKALADMRRFQR